MQDRAAAEIHAEVPVLEARGLTMRFGAVEVLSDVSLAMAAGEVHAVIGENGAGKSTLMKILSGHLAPTAGDVVLGGQALRLASPVDAERRGIVLVHQEILLAPDLSVARNIFMGREVRRGPFVDDRAMDRRAAAAVRALGVDLDPRRPVSRLSIAQRQIVQIARALDVEHRVVIFDEPTASLTPVETEALLGVIRALRERGVAVLYISHRLPEVAEIADRITVLRDGRVVARRRVGEVDTVGMAHLMVGREMARLFPERSPLPGGPPLLEARAVSVAGFARNASLAVRRGEILGLAGLVGAGRTELFEGIAGLRPITGEVLVGGMPTRFRSVRDSMRAGIAYVTEDRKGKGLLMRRDLAGNLTLAALKRFCRGFLLDAAREAAGLDEAVRRFDIRVRDRKALAGQLSGGNQQKLLLAKMLLGGPDVIVVDEPTRGIDIGTKAEIYRLLAGLAAENRAVVVISSEMAELIGLCHRILVMREGRIVGEAAGDDMTEQRLVVLAIGADPAAKPLGSAAAPARADAPAGAVDPALPTGPLEATRP